MHAYSFWKLPEEVFSKMRKKTSRREMNIREQWVLPRFPWLSQDPNNSRLRKLTVPGTVHQVRERVEAGNPGLVIPPDQRLRMPRG